MSNETNCTMPQWYWVAHRYTDFAVHRVIVPIYFFSGMFGHILCISAFVKQLKHDPAYLYQIFTSMVEILEIVTGTICILSFMWWSGAESQGAQWYMSNYACMWYATHMAIPLANMFITTSLLMSLCTALDRVYAVSKPFSYKTANHKIHKIAALCSSLILGVSTSVFDCFRYNFDWKEEKYVMSVDTVYVGSTLAFVLAHLRNAVRAAGVLALIVTNTILISSYRKHNRKIAAAAPLPPPSNEATIGRTAAPADAKEAQRRLREKTLMILTICDAVLTSIAVSFMLGYYVTAYILPTFSSCEGLLLGPIEDGVIAITEVANFYIVFAMNKQFREMVINALPSFCKKDRLTTSLCSKFLFFSSIGQTNEGTGEVIGAK